MCIRDSYGFVLQCAIFSKAKSLILLVPQKVVSATFSTSQYEHVISPENISTKNHFILEHQRRKINSMKISSGVEIDLVQKPH